MRVLLLLYRICHPFVRLHRHYCWASPHTSDIVLIVVTSSLLSLSLVTTLFERFYYYPTRQRVPLGLCTDESHRMHASHASYQPVAAGSSFGWVLLIVGPDPLSHCPPCWAALTHRHRYVKDGTYCASRTSYSEASMAKHSLW